MALGKAHRPLFWVYLTYWVLVFFLLIQKAEVSGEGCGTTVQRVACREGDVFESVVWFLGDFGGRPEAGDAMPISQPGPRSE